MLVTRKDVMARRRTDRGAVSVEYALLAIFIAIAAFIGITLLGGAVDHLFHMGGGVVPGSGE
jgi:Flp pilus assembly pilin Flp